MMTKEELAKTQREAVVAAWESTTMQNLSPLLTTDEHNYLWSCIMNLRTSGDVATFAKECRLHLPIRLFEVAAKLNVALDVLAILFPVQES